MDVKNKEQGTDNKKRRNIIIAGAVLCVAVAVGLVTLFALGYFEKVPERSVLEIEEDGRVIFEEVHEIDKDYDVNEIKKYAKKQIDSYNNEHESRSVRFKRIWKDEDRICLKTIYADAKTYSDFTGLTLFYGTVGEARKEGYKFKDHFTIMQGENAGKEISADIAAKEDTNNILILDQSLDIKMWEDVYCICGAEASVTDKGVIELEKSSDKDKNPNYDEEAIAETYIIFK